LVQTKHNQLNKEKGVVKKKQGKGPNRPKQKKGSELAGNNRRGKKKKNEPVSRKKDGQKKYQHKEEKE